MAQGGGVAPRHVSHPHSGRGPRRGALRSGADGEAGLFESESAERSAGLRTPKERVFLGAKAARWFKTPRRQDARGIRFKTPKRQDARGIRFKTPRRQVIKGVRFKALRR